MPGRPVELVERDLLGFRGGRVQRDRTGDERKRRKPFQFARGAMDALLRTRDGGGSRFKTKGGSWFRHLVKRFCGFAIRPLPDSTPMFILSL
jgi:hypothetical protein